MTRSAPSSFRSGSRYSKGKAQRVLIGWASLAMAIATSREGARQPPRRRARPRVPSLPCPAGCRAAVAVEVARAPDVPARSSMNQPPMPAPAAVTAMQAGVGEVAERYC